MNHGGEFSIHRQSSIHCQPILNPQFIVNPSSILNSSPIPHSACLAIVSSFLMSFSRTAVPRIVVFLHSRSSRHIVVLHCRPLALLFLVLAAPGILAVVAAGILARRAGEVVESGGSGRAHIRRVSPVLYVTDVNVVSMYNESMFNVGCSTYFRDFCIFDKEWWDRSPWGLHG
jgi:hypothetical protein